jgi:superfamily II helicase
VVREVSLLVYDEIHYLRDKERGVVWEETIMMAPRAARFAFLSATIPNAREFAEWVAQVHGAPCHVVYTDYRPTPLQHYIYPQGESVERLLGELWRSTRVWRQYVCGASMCAWCCACCGRWGNGLAAGQDLIPCPI